MMLRTADSCNELIHGTLYDIHHHGLLTDPRYQLTREIPAYLFKLRKPLNRICTTSLRQLNIFSAVGRVMWELRGANDLTSIAYYTPDAERYATEQVVRTAYGHRLFNGKNLMLLDTAAPYTKMLRTLEGDHASRRATALILLPEDDQQTKQEYPCFIAIQFLIRDEKVDMVAYARSSSAFRILPIDIMLMTTIQEVTARILAREIGTYTQFCGSLHVYEQDQQSQNAVASMGQMPSMTLYDQIGCSPFFTHSPYSAKATIEWHILCELEQLCRTHRCDPNDKVGAYSVFYNEYLGKSRAEWIQWAILFIVYEMIVKGATKEDYLKSMYPQHQTNIYHRMVLEYFDRKEQA